MTYRIHNTYIKPQNYYNRLFLFFGLIAISLTFTLIGFSVRFMDLFLLKFIIIYFLLLCIAALIEFYYRGEYMSPLEIFDLENFYREFMLDLNKKDVSDMLHKYDYKSKRTLEKIQNENTNYLLSSIRKRKNVYELTFINEKKMVGFLIAKFLIKGPIHKMYVMKRKKEIKICRLV